MTLERGGTLPGRGIPYLDGPIERAGCQPAVARPCDRPDRVSMTLKRGDTLPGYGIPYLDGPVD